MAYKFVTCQLKSESCEMKYILLWMFLIVKGFNFFTDNFPPKFTYVPKCIEVTLGQVAFVNVTASDNNSFTFNVLNKPNGASFNFSGNQLNFTWNVISSEKVSYLIFNSLLCKL